MQLGELQGEEMTAQQIELINRRYHELVVKEALQTITPQELLKLERYQILRRSMHGLDVVVRTQPRFDYAYRMLKKELGAHKWALNCYRGNKTQ